MKTRSIYSLILLVITIIGCNPLQDLSDSIDNHKYESRNREEIPHLEFYKKYYVSAYSEIESLEREKKTGCTVILSLRNTSQTDTLYFTKVDYYNSNGKIVKEYISNDKVIELAPLTSSEFVIEKTDTKGGTGSNFIVEYGAENTPTDKALIEAINIGNFSQHGFSFKSDVVLLSK